MQNDEALKEYKKVRLDMVGFLMERLKLGYHDIMVMPISFFKELVKWKVDRDRKVKQLLDEQLGNVQSNKPLI